MRRGRLAAWVMAATVAAVWVMTAYSGREASVGAQMARVTLGEVRQIAALTGRVTYQDETLVYAAAPGVVEEVYVREGERVAQGQALFRLDAAGYERVASAWLAAQERLQETDDLPVGSAADVQEILARTVVRAPVNGNVRQLMAVESGAVSAGMPVAVLSSTRREIVCIAAEADARHLTAGMKARLSVDGEELGQAEVTQVGEVTADAATGRMVCRVTLTPEEHIDLPTGAAVEADVLLWGQAGVSVLPVEAVTERGTVWWVCDGRCTEIPAEIVRSDEMHAWVRLPEGLTVAVGEFAQGQRVTEVLP